MPTQNQKFAKVNAEGVGVPPFVGTSPVDDALAQALGITGTPSDLQKQVLAELGRLFFQTGQPSKQLVSPPLWQSVFQARPNQQTMGAQQRSLSQENPFQILADIVNSK